MSKLSFPSRDHAYKARFEKIIKLRAIFTFIFLVILLRLSYLQLFCFQYFSKKSEHNYLVSRPLFPYRGHIVDSKERLLAGNKHVVDLFFLPQKYKQAAEDPNKREALERIGGFCLYDLQKSNPKSKRICAYPHIPFEKRAQIEEKVGFVSYLEFVERPVRFYPHRSYACHVIGYLEHGSDGTMRGKSGIEALCEEKLAGAEGSMQCVINACGQIIKTVSIHPAADGASVKLSIDLPIQECAELAFPENDKGAFIVMEADTGKIRALVSSPRFSPERFLTPISSEEWKEEFIKKEKLINRAIQALYPPASLFKLVTLAAGIEEGVVHIDDYIECNGHFKFHEKGRPYFCMRRWGHGVIPLVDALAFSCNMPCFDIGTKLDIDTFAHYAWQFGFGEKTGCLDNEKAGLVPTSSWKWRIKKEKWFKGETISASIGQIMQATPLQVVRMIASIFKGYLVTPTIFEEAGVVSKFLPLKKETMEFLQKSMKAAVEKGTCQSLYSCNSSTRTIFAKTGTAQVAGIKYQKKLAHLKEHAWCASYVSFHACPSKDLVTVVIIENQGNARPALETTKKFLDLLSMQP